MNQFIAILLAAIALAMNGSTMLGQTLTTLAAFNGANGSDPTAGLMMDSSGNLYGTTSWGGTSNLGCVFEFSPSTNALSTLANFNMTNGAGPKGTLIPDRSGNLYGTTYGGSGHGDGTVFEISAATHALTTLATFTGSNGVNADGGLAIDSAGNLFGTTQAGGASGNGTVFEISAQTHALTTIVSFNGTNGLWPSSGVILDTKGNIYGTTAAGGASNLGNVFKIDAVTHAVTTLAAFNGPNGSGGWPGLTTDASGNLYGTTSYGGKNDRGTVFRIDPTTHTLTTLASFDNTTGFDVEAGVVMDSSGNLYGTTAYGGDNNLGTVFELDATTGALSTLVSFDGSSGGNPYAGLLIGPDGNLYGTTAGAGDYPNGTIFEISVPEPASLWTLAGALALYRTRKLVFRGSQVRR